MHQSPPLYIPLPTPEEMSRWDSKSETLYGIPSLLLMENAAQTAFRELKRCASPRPGTRILIIAGKGNNGGDGFALGRILHDDGYTVTVYSVARLETLPSPAKEHAVLAKAIGVRVSEPERALENAIEPDAYEQQIKVFMGDFEPEIIVDALTGTGIRGDLREPALALVKSINAWRDRAFVFSLDIPSGLSGLSGKPLPEAVKAHATICFEAGKPGLFMPESPEYTGKVSIRRVGIPKELRKRFPPSWRLLRPGKGGWAEPSPFLHKGRAGKVLIIGGSEGMSGAPMLAAQGCLRAGAGLVHVALPSQLEAGARPGLPEALLHPVGKGRAWEGADAVSLIELVRRVSPDVLVIGPGMGREKPVGLVIKSLLELENRPPVLLDADALFFLRLPDAPASEAGATRHEEENRSRLEFSSSSSALLTDTDILTPHPGEMARILPDAFFEKNAGEPREEIKDNSDSSGEPGNAARIRFLQQDRAATARCFTESCPAVLVLKGPGTLIARAGDATTLSPFSISTLAVGGSGDVLSGVVAALVASGMDSLDAASLGVYLHGRAGELLAERAGRGHLARDIADAIPAAWEELCGR